MKKITETELVKINMRKARISAQIISKSTGVPYEDLYSEALLIILKLIRDKKEINTFVIKFRLIDYLRKGEISEKYFKRIKIFEDWKKEEKRDNDFFVKNGYYKNRYNMCNPLFYFPLYLFFEDRKRTESVQKNVEDALIGKPVERNIFIREKYFKYLDNNYTVRPYKKREFNLNLMKRAFVLYCMGKEKGRIAEILLGKNRKIYNTCEKDKYVFFIHKVKVPFTRFLEKEKLCPKDFF